MISVKRLNSTARPRISLPSSNRTGPIKAYGSPTAFVESHSAFPLRTVIGRGAIEMSQSQLIEQCRWIFPITRTPFTMVFPTHPQTKLTERIEIDLVEGTGCVGLSEVRAPSSQEGIHVLDDFCQWFR